ncbi:methyltransferase domain-containing protein [Patescibacteria group bacterium]|nr:methyltransferase domain-containing protein [Patescibacteria group bacterium]
MMPNVRQFVEVVVKAIDLAEPIVEIGSYLTSGQEELSDLRGLFSEKKYLGCDLRRGPGVDQIENAEKLSFKSNSIGTIIMLETLEHIQNPVQAADEIYRVLKKDGIVILSTVMNFQIHEFPHDYWRITPQGMEYLLKKFPQKVIGCQGEQIDNPFSVFGVGFKKNDPPAVKKLLRLLKQNQHRIKGRKPWRHRLFYTCHFVKKALTELNHQYYIDFYKPR